MPTNQVGPVWIPGRCLTEARRWCDAGLDFIYPPRCLLCTRDIPSRQHSRDGHFCEMCRDGLTQDSPRACVRCGAPVGPYLKTESGCLHCFRDKFAFARVIRLGIYHDQLRAACLRGKQRGAEGLVAALADLVWERAAEQFAEAGVNLVVPVPHHWTQRVWRPHNPAETLGEVWGRRLRVECVPPILKKLRRTPPQTHLGPQERRTNLRKAFAATESLAGSVVLLADDVLTTGTTADEAARALVEAGADRVVVAVLARGVGQH